jgi:hypothetical protein
LQGLRGLPLSYIRPMVPANDAVIERSPETGILAQLQLNSAEQKLLALLVGRHPMEQLLALDFIANESLLRGLVTFAALGLITVQPGASREDIAVEADDDDGDGEHLDPLDHRPPAYAKPPALAPGERQYVPPKVRPPTNAWPDPVPRPPPQRESEPGEGWTAQPSEPRKFVPGPALAAFEASSSPLPADSVPRALYDSLMREKQELQQRLFSLLDERNKSDAVPRELFDHAQAEKSQLQERMMLLLDELLRLRQSAQPEEKEERGPNVRPFPGSRKKE